MKKLLVMVIGAAAAFGASAIETGVGFESLSFVVGDTYTTNELNAITGDYWRDPVSATNTYTVEAMDALYYATGTRPAAFTNEDASAKALNVKTTFGNPLEFNVNAGGGSQALDGVYFDSLVKFTVCEEAPEEDYSGAKIVMWLQERYDALDDTIVEGTNLMIKAGFLTYANDAFAFSNAVYKCQNVPGDFADKWHRVTIKAIGDITEGSEVVPGFAIYIDGDAAAETVVQANTARWDDAFLAHYSLTEVARNLNNALFPSMVQGDLGPKNYLTSVGFDGTGSINELQFTTTAPDFAKDEQYLDDKLSLQIGSGASVPYKTFGAAVNAVNALGSGVNCTLSLVSDFAFNEPVTFSTQASVVFDFNGHVITNDIADCIITNNATLTVVDSVGTGGIYANVENGGAIYQGGSGVLTVSGGNFWANVVIDEPYSATIAGGSFQQDEGAFSYYDEVEGQDVYLFAAGKWLFADGENWYTIKDAFTVTFDPNNGGSATVIANVATNTPAGEISGIPATPVKAGYAFAGWTPDTNTTVIVSNTTFTAQWEANTVTVTFNKNAEAATGTMSDQTFTPGVADNLTANAFVYEGHTFEGWADDPIGEVLYVDAASATFTANTTLYAKWRTNSYTVRFFSDSEKTTQIGENQTVNYGEKATAPAAPSETGYTFTGWSPDTNNVITAATDFVAQWSLDSYTITFEPGTGATVTPATTNFTIVSGTITLPEPTGLTGVTFDGWTNATITAATKTFTPAAGNLENFTLYAKWTSLVPTPTVVTTDTVEGDTAADATAAADAAIVRTAAVEATGVSAATYATYFTKSEPVLNTETSKYEVKISIAETVQTAVEESAVTALTTSATTVTVPAGLYYKISSSGSLPIADAEPLTNLSDGTPINVSTKKPSGTSGFFKVELGAHPFE